MIFYLTLFELVILFGRSVLAAGSDDLKEVYGVVSGSAHLPCNITSPTAGDSARLVLWYKDDSPQPVYSLDARYSTVKHWSEDRNFGPRSYFRDSTDPAQLIISNVGMEDAGIYKCRIDFRKSPTVTFRVKLKIVEEPKKPVILDAEGSAVMGTIGPFRLRQALLLVCIVEGGHPAPKVIWWRDGVLWDSESDPSTYEEVLQNTLVISALDRTYHNSNFECRAINNNVTDPPKSSVTIIMEMPILEMTVSNLPDPIIADTEYDVLCQVTGSQPPPKITWTLAEVQLPSGEPMLTHGNNLTTSTLLFTPKIKDQGKVLTCKADNGVFPATNKSSVLNVYYLPIVHVEIVNDVDPSMIREGETVILKCLIQAHPWVYRILWYRDGEEIVASDRIFIDEQQVILKNVTKNMSGQYVCSAANVEGDGFSRPLLITINYKPYCVAPTIQYKRGSQGSLDLSSEADGIDLLCQVEAKPKAANYRWLFNSTDTKFEIPSAESSMTFSNYRPSDGENHGQVLCWASNDLGEQVKPCVFHVVPLGPPHPPTKCEISNHTTSTIEVTCRQGFNGGIPQHFVMEVFETVNNTQVLVASNWTDDSDLLDGTNFSLGVWGLLPSSNYIISIKAVNDRGESSQVFVGGNTVGSGSLLPLPVSTEETRMPMLFVIVGILVTLMIIGACVTATLAIRRRRMKKLAEIDIIRCSPSTDQDEQEEEESVGLMEMSEFERSPTTSNGIHRKVSFRDEDLCTSCRRDRHLVNGGHNGTPAPLTPVLSCNRRGVFPPVERAVVRTFSIDKMRPVCPVCNPGGDTPYPTGFPQRRCEDASTTTTTTVDGQVLNAVDVRRSHVRKHLIETAADIVHHKWDAGDEENDRNGNCTHMATTTHQ